MELRRDKGTDMGTDTHTHNPDSHSSRENGTHILAPIRHARHPPKPPRNPGPP
jgi:hypothetical protein